MADEKLGFNKITCEAEPIMYDTGSWQTTVTDLPPVEYAPIKHGRWIEYVNSHCECPFCHSEWSFFNNETERFDYCPNCGAIMDK